MKAARALRPSAPTAGNSNPVAGLQGLGNRFLALFPRRLPRKEFAAEVARLTLPGLHAAAVAVLGYEARRDHLVLLAAEGLSNEARNALGSGDACPWDIPIRSLRNRRISVISGAHQNPFVPRALANTSPRGLSIACLPIHHDHEPIGVMLILVAGNRSFSDAQLQTVSQALRVCAAGLRDSEGSAGRTAPSQQPENVEATIAKLVAAGAIIDPAAASAALTPPRQDAVAPAATPGPPPDDLVARVQSLERELAKAHEEIESSSRRVRQLTMSNHALARERDGLTQRLSEIEGDHGGEISELRAALEAAQERLLAVEAERARLQRLSEGRHSMAQQSIAALEQERAALESRTAAAEAQAVEVQTLLAAVLDERDRLVAQIDVLSAELRARQEVLQRLQGDTAQERTALEADRDGWKEEATAARSQLAERSSQLAETERQLRSTSVARDALLAQLQAARSEIERLTALGEELSAANAQSESARAALVAEATGLRHRLEDAQRSRSTVEQELREEILATQRQLQEEAARSDVLRSEVSDRTRLLTERDLQIQTLRQQLETAAQDRATADETLTAARHELVTLSTRLEQADEERRQWLDERAALRQSLADLRQRSSAMEVAHASAVGTLEAEIETLHRQLDSGRSERAILEERLQRAAADSGDLARRLADAQHRAENLAAAVQERDERLQQVHAELQLASSQRAALDGQLRAAQESLERHQQRAVQERSSFDAQRHAWEEQSAQLQAELTRRTESLLAHERDLQATKVTCDAALAELEAITQQRQQLSSQIEQLRNQLGQREVERDSAHTQIAELRQAWEAERAQRSETDLTLRADLAVARADAERWSRQATTLGREVEEQNRQLADRDQTVAALQREIESLRQQRADRDVLAEQAAALGRQVVDLEQQLATARAEAARAQDQSASEWETRLVELEQHLAAVRGEAAQAERQRAALNEELETARRLQAQAEVTADRKLATLRDSVDRLTSDRRRLESLAAERSAELETQRATVADLLASLEQLRNERADSQAQGQDLARQLGEAHRRLEELGAQLRERDAGIAAATADRTKLTAQITKLTAQLHSQQEALDTLKGRVALDRATVEAERDRWKDQAEAARRELDTLLASADAVTRDAAEIAAARAAVEAEAAGLRRALEAERAGHQLQEGAWNEQLCALRDEVEQRGRELSSLHETLRQRDAQIEELSSARQAQQQAEAAARAELEALQGRLATAAAENEQLRGERADLETQIAAHQATQSEEVQVLTHQLQTARTQLRALESDKSLLESALAEHQRRTHDLAGVHAAALGEMQAASEDLRRQIAELQAGRLQLLERAQRAEEGLADSTRQLEAEVNEQMRIRQLVAQLQQQLAASEERRGEIEAQATNLRGEIEAMRAATAERGALAEHAGELGQRIAELEQQVASLHGEVTRSERQRAALTEELGAAHALRAQLVEAAEGEQSRLRERLQQAAEERKRIEAIQAQQQGELESQRAQLAELRAALDEARNERLQLQQTGEDLAQQLLQAQQRIEEVSAQALEREAALQAAGADRQRLLEAVRAAEATAEMLAAQHGTEPVPASAADLPGLQAAAPAELDEGDLVIERSAPLGEVIEETAESAEPVVETHDEPVGISVDPVRELFLLDSGKRAEEAEAALKAAGFMVNHAAPTEQTAEELQQRSLGCILLNLAAGPQAWHSLKALRRKPATSSVPILAYLMPPDGKGFCFGRADFGIWPIEPERLLAQLAGLKPDLKRLLAVSADIDGMGKLRDPLAKASISTSIVLDGKQALEFTTIVAPEAAVLHLAPETAAVARAITGIRGQEPTADLPLLLLLDDVAPREDAFFAATVRQLLIKGTFQFNRLPAEIARVMA